MRWAHGRCEHVAAVGHIADGGVFFVLKHHPAAHIEADLQNGERQVFVVHDRFDEIRFFAAENVIAVKGYLYGEVFVPQAAEQKALCKIEDEQNDREQKERPHYFDQSSVGRATEESTSVMAFFWASVEPTEPLSCKRWASTGTATVLMSSGTTYAPPRTKA